MKINFIFLALSSILLCGCKRSEQNTSKKVLEYQSPITYKVEFPDTVLVNQRYDGIVHYKSSFDSIITTFGDSKKNRYTRFILTTTGNINYGQEYLKSIVKDTFGAINNRDIPFYNIKFNQAGIYYIDGVINDIILLDTISNIVDKDNSIELLTNEVRVTHKVVVLKK